jgi:hypothetical protein
MLMRILGLILGQNIFFVLMLANHDRFDISLFSFFFESQAVSEFSDISDSR